VIDPLLARIAATEPSVIGFEAPTQGDGQWGKYVQPVDRVKAERTDRRRPQNTTPLRVVVFGSHWRGTLIAERMRQLDADPSSPVEFVGLATDDLTDERAKISRGRRVWQYVDAERAQRLEDAIIGNNVEAGVPIFTGKVKSPAFKNEVLTTWKPDVIVMGTFGQLIDSDIFDYPRYGHYNLHPSDLAAGKGAGGDPFTDTIAARERQTCVTCHQVDAGFDTGMPVGRSLYISTGYDELTARGVDPRELHPAWIDALHWVTGAIAAEMAAQLVTEIGRTRQAVNHMTFVPEHPASHYDAVPDVTYNALDFRRNADYSARSWQTRESSRPTLPCDLPAELLEPPLELRFL
jgi:methionyl-tRNA formyltransferase